MSKVLRYTMLSLQVQSDTNDMKDLPYIAKPRIVSRLYSGSWAKRPISTPAIKTSLIQDTTKYQAPIVQTVDKALHQINHYPADTFQGNQLRYPVYTLLDNRAQYVKVQQNCQDQQKLPSFKNRHVRNRTTCLHHRTVRREGSGRCKKASSNNDNFISIKIVTKSLLEKQT